MNETVWCRLSGTSIETPSRGLVEKPEDWPWSSVHGYLKRPTPIEIVDAKLFRQQEFDRLKREGRTNREVIEMMRQSRVKPRKKGVAANESD
jgi:hypothetical protein